MKNFLKIGLKSNEQSVASKFTVMKKKTEPAKIKKDVEVKKTEEDAVVGGTTSNVIDGRAIAKKHEKAIEKRIKLLKLGKNKPNITSILVGDDPASVIYVHMKQKKAQALGIQFDLIEYPSDTPFEEIAEKIKELNKNKYVDGIMVQLPSLSGLTDLIYPKKDVDGLTSKGKYLPAAVRAVMTILDDEKIDLKGKIVTIIGSSELVGTPIAKELKKRGAKVTVCDIATRNLREETLKSDILVSATGETGLVIGKMVKEGVVIIDVGTVVIKDHASNQVVGDVDFESVAPKASKITPVPGGVGPVTVISLMENVVDAAEKRK